MNPHYIRDNHAISMLRFTFYQLTHSLRSKCCVGVQTDRPMLVFATIKPLGKDKPQTIVSSRITPDSAELWFYLPPGTYFFYTLDYNTGDDVFAHYRDVYGDPGMATFVGEFIAIR